MGRPKIRIPTKDLERLYLSEGLTPAKIAEQYGCTVITVRNRLIEAKIPLKSKSIAQTHYTKNDFTGTPEEKAYMLGFRYGDLNVYQPTPRSETLVVRCHTTHSAQEDLFRNIFAKYGHVNASRNARSVHLNCYLNTSFLFLLPKYNEEVRNWLYSDESLLWAFAAGYIDAEGTFGLNQAKGRFKIDAYDKSILDDIHALFQKCGINSKSRIIARKGANDYGWIWKQDVWRVSVNEAKSLELLISKLMPYLQHAKRISDAKIVIKNIEERKQRGSLSYARTN